MGNLFYVKPACRHLCQTILAVIIWSEISLQRFLVLKLWYEGLTENWPLLSDSSKELAPFLSAMEGNDYLIVGGGHSKIFMDFIQQEVQRAAGVWGRKRKTDKHQTTLDTPHLSHMLLLRGKQLKKSCLFRGTCEMKSRWCLVHGVACNMNSNVETWKSIKPCWPVLIFLLFSISMNLNYINCIFNMYTFNRYFQHKYGCTNA